MYNVKQMHPTLSFLKWDYGSLDAKQEQEYVDAKLMTLQTKPSKTEVSTLTTLIVQSQRLMREYAREHITGLLDKNHPELATSFAECCVSQRDIQRVFTFFEHLKHIYDQYSPHGVYYDYNAHAMFVSLALVYFLRLDTPYRIKYAAHFDKQCSSSLGAQTSFTKALHKDLTWIVKDAQVPKGIALTQALLENFFAIIMCSITHTPLIITGDPGSSKTISFNLVMSNCKGQGSKRIEFQDTSLFPKLEPHYYQCSRRTTAREVEKVISIAGKRQDDYVAGKLPVNCVVFMDEAGLPEKHNELKVLHPHLDMQKVSIVAITNTILDAAKTNRAISLFRPASTEEDIESLTRGCLDDTVIAPNTIDYIVGISGAYTKLMRNHQLRSFYGLRDFIHFVMYLHRKVQTEGTINSKSVLNALERNFSGSNEFPLICTTFLHKVQMYVTNIVR